MMDNTPFDKITISELVARASFYRNYTDKSDVLRQESDRLMKEWGGKFKIDGSDNGSETLVSLLDYIQSNSHFYLCLYHAGQDTILRETILAQFPIAEDAPNMIVYLSSSIGYMT